MRGFKELWMEMRSLHLLTPTLPFSRLYSPVERKSNQQPPPLAFTLGLLRKEWKREKALSKDKKEEKGLEGDPQGQRLYLWEGSCPPGQMLLFQDLPQQQEQRVTQEGDRIQVCMLHPLLHPLRAKPIPSSKALFFAWHPQQDTLLAVGSGQLQLDSSTSQMRVSRHLHDTDLHTSNVPLPIWQEQYQSLPGIPGNRFSKHKNKFHFTLQLPCSGPITSSVQQELKSCLSLKARCVLWSLQHWDPSDL